MLSHNCLIELDFEEAESLLGADTNATTIMIEDEVIKSEKQRKAPGFTSEEDTDDRTEVVPTVLLIIIKHVRKMFLHQIFDYVFFSISFTKASFWGKESGSFLDV